MKIDDKIKKAAEIISEAEAILFTAGAGIGVDSGLPDFRGNEGFWRAYPPIAKLGIPFYEMANPHWFTSRPGLAWAFYGHRLNLYRKTVPHKGFSLMLKMAENKPGSYFVFTSNVDGQFQKAGFDSKRIAECHGSIHHFQCHSLCNNEIWDAADIEVEVDEEKFEALDPLPRCPNCGSLARPNILMFGDWGWIDSRTNAQERRLESWINSNSDSKIAIIECGAGTAVPTVRYKSESVARKRSRTLIRINPRESNVPEGHISIPLGAGEGIERIFELI